MRLSTISVLAISFSSVFAVPIASKRSPGFFGDLETGLKNLANSNATVSGVISTIGQSIANPKLTAARLEVVKSLSDTTGALNQISSQATASNNAGIAPLVTQAQQGVKQAQDGVDNIGEALVSGATPSKTDQKSVAVGIKQALLAINAMPAAVTTANSALSSAISSGQSAVASLSQGGQGVLSASGLSLTDLGLPADFATSDSLTS
ncbi:hypothetical protein M422DRAFT_248436 [Sphaerobolus stellatus SS14]|uniref:Cell wall protein n=1 Tax=Sphaerobolus stellatus (strain SS14) TaxID=990650 RepID=A0A0C9W4M5_SPHS4|nr:hypothetical protein M422DRAFT_248436 [Sphaerobolus stellatus SS14]